MKAAKLFNHAGSQAVRLPRAFSFSGSEVLIEKHGDEVVLRPVAPSRFKSFTEIAEHLGEAFPDTDDFPDPPPRPPAHARAVLGFKLLASTTPNSNASKA